MAQTLSHSEENKGFTSFWDYIPEWFTRLGNNFYTIHNGQLWIHHDYENQVMNNFYGTQYNTSIKTVFNDAMANDKSFKTLVLESAQKWYAYVKTNYTESSIASAEFNTRESRQFSFIRQNENAEDLHGGAAQGIGIITSVIGNQITFGVIPEFVNAGDVLKQLNGESQEVIGTIISVDGPVITVSAVTTVPVPGYYSFAQKNARSEGSDVRGYYLEVLLVNDNTEQSELFAVSTETSKSYV